MAGTPNSYGFSDTTDHDIVLRSSDNVDFYVIGAFLRYVSSVFKDMFASSGPDNNEKKGDLPIVSVAEDSETLRLLLDYIYPYKEEPQLSSPTIAWKVSKATQKYMMDIIESKLKTQIIKSKMIKEKPLSIYAIAIDLGWEDVALKAAQQTLIKPLQKLAYTDELQLITGAGFYRFLEYRRWCDKDRKNRQKVPLPHLRRHADEAHPNQTSRSDQTDGQALSITSESYPQSGLSDLIIRTSDRIDFYVFAALLRHNSPFFNQKIPPEDPVTNGLRVINVEENSNVLCLLLGFIYPPQEPDISDIARYAQLTFAARKYEMVGVENRIKKHAIASYLITAEPFRMYSIASALGWESLAKTAALNTRHTPFHELNYVDEMHLMTGAQLFRFMRYRFLCADAARSALTTCTPNQNDWPVLQIVVDTVFDDLPQLLEACPHGSIVTDFYDRVLSKKIAETKTFRNHNSLGTSNFELFVTLQYITNAPKAIEEAVSKVDLLSY